MTIEQAIRIIENVDICANQAETARNMAIDALKKKEEHLEIIRDLVGQFAYKVTVNGCPAYITGGL